MTQLDNPRRASWSEASWPRVPVFFVTTDGQTERVAERLVEHLREDGLESATFDLSEEGEVLCASVHVGGHQRCARRFAMAHRDRLARVPSLFLFVCLAIRSSRAEEREAAERIAHSFGLRTRWRPDESVCVAGRLAYTRYGWLRRFVMKRIAAREGGSTDTSRDHEYTDWDQVERLAHAFSERLRDAVRSR